ncbi:helix-turn-helix transcriptional regulator [Bradyrhizobium guangzhouense]|uniref:helix-turn-helix transcriptional regulator n=1 Tax=Bradyrhizobium guangzhouense TaxID=1325095 RepID=UPI001009ED1D|nr:helix-turn-helix transcriptional regulator [Bradyrhizobium guangzhouense]
MITEQVGAHGAILIPATGSPALPNYPSTASIEEANERYFRGGWYLRDERYRGLPLMQKRGIFDDLDLFTQDEIDRHPYYQEFLAPTGLLWFAGVHVRCGDDTWCLSIQRRKDQGPFSSADKRKLLRLSEAASAAATTARALGFIAAEGVLEAFEISGWATLLLDRDGRIARINRSAEALLREEWQVSEGRLCGLERQASDSYDRVLRTMLYGGENTANSAVVLLPRLLKHPLIAHFLRLPTLSGNALGQCQLAVVLVDPDQRFSPSAMILRTTFGLTPAEARVAASLAGGMELESIAASLHISPTTARNQLKSVFGKTRTRRQPELVALLAAIARPPVR